MRDLINIINEKALSKSELVKYDKKYLNNLLGLVNAGTPLEIAPDAQEYLGKSVVIDPSSIDEFLAMLDNKSIKNPTLKTQDGSIVQLNRIQKSAAIKGKDVDYNVGDIGEIALGVAAAARFRKLGQVIDINDFTNLSKELNLSNVSGQKGKKLSSLKLEISTKIKHISGKDDILELKILAPARSIQTFEKLMKDSNTAPINIQGTILSAISYANESNKITFGIEKTAMDPNVNTISVVSDGVSNQKGTKADLIMTIDGQTINLISAKAGKSQLGQAAGHEWYKQQQFFNTVFGVDISAYEKYWGKTHQEHISALMQVYANAIIPKVAQLVGGNNTAKEMSLIRQITQGLIRYSNNVHPETGEVEVIDIVKLITNPGSPGYKLLRVDARLEQALAQVNLVGAATKNRQGVEVHGVVGGKSVLLFKVRSYYSPAGKTTRTIIEGGPLLDQLAEMAPEQPKVQPPPPQPTVTPPPPTQTAPVQAPAPVAESIGRERRVMPDVFVRTRR